MCVIGKASTITDRGGFNLFFFFQKKGENLENDCREGRELHRTILL